MDSSDQIPNISTVPELMLDYQVISTAPIITMQPFILLATWPFLQVNGPNTVNCTYEFKMFVECVGTV